MMDSSVNSNTNNNANTTNNCMSRNSVREDFQEYHRRRSPHVATPSPNKTNDNRNSSECVEQDDDANAVDDFMMRIVHGSCQSWGSGFNETSGMDTCMGCQGAIEDQIDLLTHCHQPLSFLSFFHEHNSDESRGVEVLPAGAYVMPTSCEYCGAEHTQSCEKGKCQRPALFFQKKRAPFQKPDPQQWDPVTDHYIGTRKQKPQQSSSSNNKNKKDGSDKRPISPSILPPTATWITDFFHTSSTNVNTTAANAQTTTR